MVPLLEKVCSRIVYRYVIEFCWYKIPEVLVSVISSQKWYFFLSDIGTSLSMELLTLVMLTGVLRTPQSIKTCFARFTASFIDGKCCTSASGVQPSCQEYSGMIQWCTAIMLTALWIWNIAACFKTRILGLRLSLFFSEWRMVSLLWEKWGFNSKNLSLECWEDLCRKP